MLLALYSIDKKDSLELRKATRESHVEYLKTASVAVKLAGPLYEGEDVGNMIGSLVVIEANSLDDAKTFSANDPYAKAGLFESVEIKPWNLVINNTNET